MFVFACGGAGRRRRDRRRGHHRTTTDASPDGPASCPNAIAFRSASTATAGSGNLVTVPTPAGVAEGDLMVAAVVFQADSDEQPGTLSTPAAWTNLRQDAFGINGGIGLATFTRTVTALEPATHPFSTTGGSKRFVVHVLAYANVDTTNPIADAQSGLATSATTVVAPSVSSPACGMVVGAFAIRTVTTLDPMAMTERADVNNASGAAITLATADELAVGGGGTGSRSALAADGPAATIGQLLALRPQ